MQSGTHLTCGGTYFSSYPWLWCLCFGFACPKNWERAPHRPARTVFCGTLIYSLNLRMNHMILVVKTSEEYVTFATPTRFFHVYFSTLSPIKSEAVSFWYEVFFPKLQCECDDTGKLLWWYSSENIWGFRERQNSRVGPSVWLKSGTLEGLTDHIRILHTSCSLCVFDLDVRLFFSILLSF